MPRLLLFCILVIFFKLTHAQSSLYPIRSNNMWGLMDSKGKLVLDAEFKNIGEFEPEGIALAQKGDLIGVIDSTGNLVIPCQYHSMDYIGQGLFSIKDLTH